MLAMMRRRAPLLLLLIASQLAFADLVVQRMAARREAEPTVWEISAQPQSLWSAKPLRSNLSRHGPDSVANVGTAPASEFSLAGVPAERLEATRGLLAELKARPVDGTIVVDLPGDVLFDFDKDTLRTDAIVVLDRLVQLLSGFEGRAVAISGHTDSKGDDDYNDALSERRADRVRDYLVRHATGSRNYETRGFGERKPVAPNTQPDGRDDPQGRQKNRRVEIVIAAPEKE